MLCGMRLPVQALVATSRAAVAAVSALRAARRWRPVQPTAFVTPAWAMDVRRFQSGGSGSGRLPAAELEDVVEATAGPGPLLVDVREVHEYHHGRVPTAVNLPLSRLDEALAMDAEAFAMEFGFARPQGDRPLLVYCMKGVRSRMAQERLLRAGYDDVRNYLGSYAEWAASGQPIERST